MRGIFICAFAFCVFIINSSQQKSPRCEASPSCMCFSTQHSFRTERMSHGSVCSLSLVARCRTVKRSLDPGRSSNSAAPNSQEVGAGVSMISTQNVQIEAYTLHPLHLTRICKYEFGGQSFHGPRRRALSNTPRDFSCSGGAFSCQRTGDDDDGLVPSPQSRRRSRPQSRLQWRSPSRVQRPSRSRLWALSFSLGIWVALSLSIGFTYQFRFRPRSQPPLSGLPSASICGAFFHSLIQRPRSRGLVRHWSVLFGRLRH